MSVVRRVETGTGTVEVASHAAPDSWRHATGVSMLHDVSLPDDGPWLGKVSESTDGRFRAMWPGELPEGCPEQTRERAELGHRTLAEAAEVLALLHELKEGA